MASPQKMATPEIKTQYSSPWSSRSDPLVDRASSVYRGPLQVLQKMEDEWSHAERFVIAFRTRQATQHTEAGGLTCPCGASTVSFWEHIRRLDVDLEG